MEITDGVRRHGGDEDGIPFLDVYNSGAEKYPILEGEWTDEIREVRDVKEDAIEDVNQIKAERGSFQAFVEKLGQIDNPALVDRCGTPEEEGAWLFNVERAVARGNGQVDHTLEFQFGVVPNCGPKRQRYISVIRESGIIVPTPAPTPEAPVIVPTPTEQTVRPSQTPVREMGEPTESPAQTPLRTVGQPN
jgi:hypothetical protein